MYLFIVNGKIESNSIFFFFCSLSMHTERPWIFSKCVRSNYSEEDYKLKFWAYIIETFFAHKQNMVLQW
jgi:hypothetical protein